MCVNNVQCTLFNGPKKKTRIEEEEEEEKECESILP